MEEKKSFKQKYKESLKSMDTEETIDLMFYRPVGFAWALLCAKIGITPNVITIASIFLGIGGGLLFYYNDIWWNMLGMFFIIWANSFDSADGLLARITGQYSSLGRFLVGFSRYLGFITMFFSVTSVARA